MSAHDLIYGTVTLPDGRQCEAKLWGYAQGEYTGAFGLPLMIFAN